MHWQTESFRKSSKSWPPCCTQRPGFSCVPALHCQGDGFISLIFHLAPGPCTAEASASWQCFPREPCSLGCRAPCTLSSPLKAHQAGVSPKFALSQDKWAVNDQPTEPLTGLQENHLSLGSVGVKVEIPEQKEEILEKISIFGYATLTEQLKHPWWSQASHFRSTPCMCFLDCHSTILLFFFSQQQVQCYI